MEDSFSERETFGLAQKIGENAKPGEVYSLDGDLGVGKTVFSKGFAKGLGIDEAVNSPTFTIVQQYEGERVPFYHFDVYRISCLEEMDEIGYEDYFYGQGVCLVEWGNLIKELLPAHTIHVQIAKDLNKGFDYRKILVQHYK